MGKERRRKHMKKALCIVLSVLMLVSLIPMAVFATGETVTYGNSGLHTLTVLDNEKLADASAAYVCRIGDGASTETTTYYTSLKAAYDALPAGNDASANPSAITVTMIKDITGGFRDTDTANAKAMILDGNGFTWINNVSQYAFIWVNADFIAKNLTYGGSSTDNVMTRGFQFRAHDGSIQMDISLENCTFTSENIGIDLRGSDNVNTYKHTLNIDNCDVSVLSTATGQNSYALYGNHGTTADWNITINNSKLVSKNNNTTSGNPNCVIGLHNACDFNIDIKGNTVIEAATNSNTYGNYGIGIFQATSLNMTLEDTVTIELNVPDNLDVVSTFASINTGNVTDKGATYKANANAAKCGVVVPNFGPAYSTAAKVLAGYAVEKNATVYTGLGETYKGNAAVTFYPVYADALTDDSEAIKEGNVAKTDVNGDGVPEYHKTITAAVATLPAGAQLDGMTDAEKAKHTVTLLCDIGDAGWGPGGGNNYFSNSSALIFDGNGNDVVLGKYNETTPHYYTAFEPTGSDLVVQNVPRFECGRLARVRCNVDDVDVTVKNSNIIAFACQGLYLTSTGTAVKDVTGYVTIDGSSITTANTLTGNNASPIFAHYDNQCGDINWVININDSTITQSGTNISSYDAAIVSHTGEDLEINLTGNTVINIAGGTTAEPTTANHYGIYVADSHADNNVSINIEPTVQFNAELPETTVTGNVVFIKAPVKAVIDNAGKFKAGASALKLGVVLPSDANVGDDALFIGWSDGKKDIIDEGVYTVADATEAVSFVPVSASFSDFFMKTGAALKTDGTIAIRFTAVFGGKLKEKFGDKVTFGTLIAVADDSLTEDNFKRGEMSSAIAYTELRELGYGTDADGNVLVYSCLVDLPENEAGVLTEFTARSYCTITYESGVTKTIYADWSAEDNVRSAYEIAVAASAAEGSNASYDKIIAAGGADNA